MVKKKDNNKCWGGYKKSESSYITSGTVEWYSHLEKSLAVAQKVKHRVAI